ncbi:uncharacterized protein LOC141898392 [Tubulanus polymorphus]|uniref:uncharacterized protein LOC141898392 n=1 Tax=Tubulanus polymorphus TaxID=672921 RepID=UPI003DA384A1
MTFEPSEVAPANSKNENYKFEDCSSKIARFCKRPTSRASCGDATFASDFSSFPPMNNGTSGDAGPRPPPKQRHSRCFNACYAISKQPLIQPFTIMCRWRIFAMSTRTTIHYPE